MTIELAERNIPHVGLVRFENFGPGEWLTKKGEPAKIARRRYLLGDDDDQLLDSVSSIVGTLDKPGLYSWYEDHGARGGVRAERMGELKDVPEEEYIQRVRVLGLGADTARDDGADRGKAIHAAFQSLAESGSPPNAADFPGPWRPWVQGAVRAWLAMNPTPIASELIVCNPEYMYAGRLDLIAKVRGLTTLVDYKTGKGRVYDQAHFQTRGYAEALLHEGESVDRIVIVGVDNEGGFELVDCEATRDDWVALARTFAGRRRINAGMAAQRKAAKQALKKAA